MAVFSASLALPAQSAVSGAPICEVYSGPTDYPLITEVGLDLSVSTTAGVAVLGIGRPASKGIPKNAYSAFVAHDPNGQPSGLTIATEWLTLPTAPTNYLYRENLSANTAFIFPCRTRPRFRRFSLVPSSSFVIWMVSIPAQTSGLGVMGEVEVTVDV